VAFGPCGFESHLRHKHEIPAKLDKTLIERRDPSNAMGLFYTNYYTNALGKGILHRFGGAVLHCGEHMRVGV
jgi:outer membrane lipopolysaccharide assembly protein LptE/RlpB